MPYSHLLPLLLQALLLCTRQRLCLHTLPLNPLPLLLLSPLIGLTNSCLQWTGKQAGKGADRQAARC